jgi:hypothetical protein
MAEHHDALFVFAPQEQTHRTHLLGDGGDRDIGTQVVAGDCDGDAVRVRTRGNLAELARMQRAPPAAVDEQRQRCAIIGRAVIPRRENIDELPLARSVFQSEFGLGRRLAVRFGVAVPARENIDVLRHAGPVVVFLLVVDRHVEPLRPRDSGASAAVRQRLSSATKRRYL